MDKVSAALGELCPKLKELEKISRIMDVDADLGSHQKYNGLGDGSKTRWLGTEWSKDLSWRTGRFYDEDFPHDDTSTQ